VKINSDIFRIETNHVIPKQGHILIAEPFLPGSYFNRSIIILVSCDNDGVVGFILNKKVDFPIENQAIDLSDFDVHIGGPVETDSLFFIHTLGHTIPGSLRIRGNLFWGGDLEVLKMQIKLGLVDHSQVRFFLGYSGWAIGQLEEEINENSWLVAKIPGFDLMGMNDDQMWVNAVRLMGGKYSMWENFPENPSLN
jgi:putative transcriptional regulator